MRGLKEEWGKIVINWKETIMIAKEYIEREAAQKVLTDHYAYNAAELLDTVPIVDVQEVVRCKDCIFGKYDDDLNMILCKRIYNLSDGEYVYNDLNDFLQLR